MTPLTWALAPWPASATSWLTFASREPRPPTVHWMAASRPTRARSRLKCQVAESQFWMLTNRNREPWPCDDLDRPDVQAGASPRSGRRCLADQGRLGPLFEHDQRVAQVDTALAGQPDQAEQRGLDLDAPGARKATSRRSRTPRGGRRRRRRRA